MIAEALFYLFSAIIVIAVIWMIFIRNLIHATFLFLVVLLSLAAIYVLLQATFIAVVQLLVYAGGVVVLLAFGITLTRRSKDQRLLSGSHLLVPGGLLFFSLALIIVWIVSQIQSGSPSSVNPLSIESIGILFMTDYLLAFELIAYILLVVLVGATYYAKQARI